MTSKIVVNNIEADSGINTITFINEVTAPTFNGNIVGTAATFSGNVDIGGALTYEDVTNVDSVGIVTSRSGIHVTGGLVGIGTDNPNASLHVEKDGTSQVLARFESNMGTNNNRSIALSSPTSDSGSEPFIFNTGNAYQFQTDDQVGLHINYNRKIGIGTDNPAGTLEIDAASTTDMIMLDASGTNFARIGHNSASGTAVLDVRSEGHTRFLTNGNNEQLRITSGGNIGIGSVVPQSKLDVAGEIRASGIALTDSYPTIPTSLNLNFARSRSLDSRITFTRGSVGTHVGPDRLIKTDADDEPRFDHDPSTGESLGLLIEESRTNYGVYSSEFDNAAHNKLTATVSANQAVAPDGTTTADLLYPNSSGTGRGLEDVYALPSTGFYTTSLYVKAAGLSWVQLYAVNGGQRAYFNVSTGTKGSQTGGGSLENWDIIDAGNGWYRIYVTYNLTSTSNNEYYYVYFSDGDNNGSVTANGTDGVYLWGLQVEKGSFPTSYIPTSGAAVTRAADNAEIKYDGWYDNSSSVKPSTFVGKFQTYNLAATRIVAEGANGSTFKDFSMNTMSNSSDLQFSHRYTANNSYDNSEGANITVNTPVTFAFSFDGTGGDITGSANGTTPIVGTDDLGVIQSGGDRMRIGSRGNNSLYLNGTISELRYYKFKATSDQLLLLQ